MITMVLTKGGKKVRIRGDVITEASQRDRDLEMLHLQPSGGRERPGAEECRWPLERQARKHILP